MSSSEFEDTIELTRTCMRLTGVWPETKQYSSMRVFFLMFSMTFFIIIPQTTELCRVSHSLSDIIQVLTIGLGMMFVAVCKYFNQWHRRRGNLRYNSTFEILIYLFIFNKQHCHFHVYNLKRKIKNNFHKFEFIIHYT